MISAVWNWFKPWALVRILVFAVPLLVLYAGVQFLLHLAIAGSSSVVQSVALVIGELILCAIMIGAYACGVRILERRPAEELKATKALPGVFSGAGIGVLLFFAAFGVLWILRVGEISQVNDGRDLLIIFALSLSAAVAEEIIFRGVLFRIVEDSAGTLVAIIVSGSLFGLAHLGNSGATITSSVAIALEAGVLLGVAFALTRRLWFPIGLHFGWDFTETGLFGQQLPQGHYHGVMALNLTGSNLMTGGTFGAEASLPAVGVCAVATLALLVVLLRRGEWKPARWLRT